MFEAIVRGRGPTHGEPVEMAKVASFSDKLRVYQGRTREL